MGSDATSARPPAGLGDGEPFDSWQRRSVLTSLRMAPSWALPSLQWAALDAVLDQLAAALADGDSAAFGHVCSGLLAIAPKRATPLGDEPVVPAPEPIRERINELVHGLVDTPTTRRDPDDSHGHLPSEGRHLP